MQSRGRRWQPADTGAHLNSFRSTQWQRIWGDREQRVFVGISVATKLQGLMDSNVNPVNNLCGITFCLRQLDCENIQRTCWLAAGSWHSHPSFLGSLGGCTIISLKNWLHRGGKCLLGDHEDWPGTSSTAWENWCRGKDRISFWGPWFCVKCKIFLL